MKYLAPLLVVFSLVEFTTPNDHSIWVNRDQVVAVTHAASYDCKEGSKTKIIYGVSYSCVKETPEEVVNRLTAGSPKGDKVQ